MEKKHAMLSPSSAVRWMVCSGAPAMEHGLPDTPNEDSSQGQCGHAIAAACLMESRPAAAYIGRRVDVGPHETYEFREDMAEPVQRYVDFVRSLPGEKHIEVAVPIDHITLEEGAEGTADVVALNDDEIICCDLKFGYRVVSAEKNWQAMLYASGAIRKFDVIGDQFKKIKVYIFQPRVRDEPSEWSCTVEELNEYMKECTEAAKTATIAHEFRDNWMNKPDQQQYLVPGDEQCQFCKARSTCPAVAEYVTKNVGQDFDMIPASGMTGAESIVSSGYQITCSDADLAKRMQACDLIELWIKAVRAEVERRLLANIIVPGYKLVTGRQGNRKWTDDKAAEEMLRKQFRLPIEEAYDLKLISPTKAEALLAKEHPKRWAKLQDIIGRAPGVPSVAPVGDARPALDVKSVADDLDGGVVVEDGSDLV